MDQPWKQVWSFCALLVCLASTATAQCIRPDGLDGGPCCAAATPRYPTPPSFTQNSVMICWKDCNVEATNNCTAIWGASTFSTTGSCKRIRQSLDLVDAAGVVKWKGRLTLQYSRTWLETDPAGIDMQVWRYLANGDLRPTSSAGSSPCPVPPCASANGGRVRFTGYRDFVVECGTNVRHNAWMLTHACDLIDHNPGFPRGGTFHPERSYTLVGPSASFAIGSPQPVEVGGSSFEAVRRVGSPGALVCEYEEPIQFTLSPQQQLCVCGTPTASPRWVVSDLNLAGACGTNINTPGGPFLPGFLSMEIGMWTDPTTYPGLEMLRYNAGGYDYIDPCLGVVRQEVFYGVTTNRGFPARQILNSGVGLALPLIFIDQANSVTSVAGATGTTMNVPFRSEHVLNLNL